ncbi:carbohydrate esterase family 4 protein [Macrolepiota fuliginosa MF-IS2]|uniref:Carbohydrate esterase family 4 protein n=1 Tax=Macrolepiota fuliginosa MF-IS2 TaxID=1400762 RepID=A0A9P5XKC2_9AGAR|nr:carbohydrate esterase family 4 protein [Macrolepiota fuliginosa MF-IS2]
MIFNARATVVVALLGFVFDAFVGVGAAPTSPAALAKVVRSCTQPKVAALTFDDGPFMYTRDAVSILNKYGAKGTFFVNGKNWGCIYDTASVDTLRNTLANGHQVASHTWAHKDLTTLSRPEVVDEMTKSHVAIQRITGVNVAYMRPPFGYYNNQVREVAASLGETIVTWDFDSGDSTGKSVQQQKDQYHQVASQKPNSVLSLQHDVHETSVHQVLEYAIQQLQGAGYELVTLAECLGAQPYHNVGKPESRTSDWHC